MRTTWPVSIRNKGAEIFQGFDSAKATVRVDMVNCPYCDELQEPIRVGLMDCQECGKTFETFLKDVD